MAHQLLTLNDTAMLLLQEYVELTDQATAIFHSLSQGLSASEIFSQEFISQFSAHTQSSSGLIARFATVQTALLEEIRLLSTSPDIQPIHSLDWHLTFDESLMETMERHFLANAGLDSNPTAPIGIVGMDIGFMSQLVEAYKAALTARQAASGKDQS